MPQPRDPQMAASNRDEVEGFRLATGTFSCWQEGRQRKSIVFVITCLLLGVLPHWLRLGPWPAVVVGLLMGRHIFPSARARMFDVLANGPEAATHQDQGRDPADDTAPAAPLPADAPSIDLLVAAKNEVAVIERLVTNLLALRYRLNRLKVWIIDDASTDGTAEVLDQLQAGDQRLEVIHRAPGAGGSKSGALNAALPHLQGEWVMVLDADAQLHPDALEQLLPLLQDQSRGLQLRKAVSNVHHNLLTRVQALEMAFDAFIQRIRIANSGMGELRGNGELIPRAALLACGGFNEATITDDLDLSIRLQLCGVPIDLAWNPPVAEEAVVTLRSLWPQHQRWAEGGLQRFFDYWPALLSSSLGTTRRRDVLVFFLLQYAVPMVSLGDVMAALWFRSLPLSWPLTAMALVFAGSVLWRCQWVRSDGPAVPAARGFTFLAALVYLLHWQVLIPLVTLCMALRPKQLVWQKTLHEGLMAGS